MIDEKSIKLIAKSLNKNCQGVENGIKKDDLILKLATAKQPIIVDKIELDDIMQIIRGSDFCDGILIENKGAYYISTDQTEISNYIIYLELRANELLKMRETILQKKEKSNH